MSKRSPIRPIRHDGRDYLATAQVASLLGVKVESVYAYVSRGLLRSTRLRGVRGSVFPLAEVKALAEQSGRGRTPSGSVERITTEITLIDDDRLFYRGRPVIELATEAGFPVVADLLWGVEHSPDTWAAALRTADGLAPRLADFASGLPPTAGAVDVIRAGIGWFGAADQLRHFVSTPHTVERARSTIAGVVALLAERARSRDGASGGTGGAGTSGGTGASAGTDESDASAGTGGFADSGDRPAGPNASDDTGLTNRIWTALADREPSSDELAILQAALILLADHDLAASTVAARVAASARASIYAVLGAGIGVLDSPLHGGSGRLCLRFLTTALDDPSAAIAEQLASGAPLPGWGQVIYSERDPRADLLLDLLTRLPGADQRALAAIEACRPMQATTDRPFPNIDLALAAMTLVLRLRPETPETGFALARMVGWTAHALEEYAAPPLRFRPVGVYVGVRPGR